jgi:hypothetical protein
MPRAVFFQGEPPASHRVGVVVILDLAAAAGQPGDGLGESVVEADAAL